MRRLLAVMLLATGLVAVTPAVGTGTVAVWDRINESRNMIPERDRCDAGEDLQVTGKFRDDAIPQYFYEAITSADNPLTSEVLARSLRVLGQQGGQVVTLVEKERTSTVVIDADGTWNFVIRVVVDEADLDDMLSATLILIFTRFDLPPADDPNTSNTAIHLKCI